MRGLIFHAVFGLTMVGVALVGGPRTAIAAPATGVAVTSMTTYGVDAAAVPSFAKSLSGGLAAGGLKVTGLKKVQDSLKPHEGLAGCETAVCLRRIGMLLQVPLCGKATVEASSSTTFRIEVVLTASVSGKQISRVERRCELCTLAEARDALSRTAADAAKKAATVPGLVPPRSKARKPPQRRVVRRRAIRKPRPPRIKIVDQGKSWRRWGLVTAGVGVAALIPGIVLLAMDGKVKDGGCDGRRCIYTTKGGGAAFTAIGAAAIAAGTGMLIYGLIRKHTKIRIRYTIGIDPRGSLFVWGQF